jgi:hypothetical protein
MSSKQVYSHVATRGDDEIPVVEGVAVTNSSNITSTNQYVGKIIAPATLPEGYELPVTLGSSQFNIQIPKGGVEQGQEFSVSIPNGIASSSSVPTIMSTLPPVGVWRDNICHCCTYGFCHPHCLTSTCCPLCKFL